MVEEGGTTTVAAADARYTFDDEKLAELRKANPWKDEPRYFKNKVFYLNLHKFH